MNQNCSPLPLPAVVHSISGQGRGATFGDVRSSLACANIEQNGTTVTLCWIRAVGAGFIRRLKSLTIVLRLLLGLMFVVFGSNAFLNFMPMPPLPDTPAGHFISAMVASHYIYGVALFEIVGGLLLVIGRCVPLGLAFLGPIIVNIDLYHIFMDRSGLAIAGVVSCIALFLLWRYREAFAGLLRP